MNGKILTLVSSTSLASSVANAALPSRFQPRPPGPTPLPQRAHTSWDLPVLYADGVGVKRQQVPGGCRPPFRCSGTRGELICTLSQPSLPRNLAGKETAAGGPTETHRREEGGWWAGCRAGLRLPTHTQCCSSVHLF